MYRWKEPCSGCGNHLRFFEYNHPWLSLLEQFSVPVCQSSIPLWALKKLSITLSKSVGKGTYANILLTVSVSFIRTKCPVHRIHRFSRLWIIINLRLVDSSIQLLIHFFRQKHNDQNVLHFTGLLLNVSITPRLISDWSDQLLATLSWTVFNSSR